MFVVAFFAMIAAYLLFALSACFVPTTPIRQNVANTIAKGDLEEDYPHAIVPYDSYRENCYQGCRDKSRMDNFTDALIISQAYYCDNDDLRRSVFLVPYASAERGTPNIMTDNLKNLVNGEGVVVEKNYPRYWHGSAFLMRYLLLFANYQKLRYVFYVVSSFLLLLTVLRLWRVVGMPVALAYFFALLMVNVYVMQFSIQFLPVLVITLVATLMVCDSSVDRAMLFMLTGSLTAFFDLLTTPLLTLGMPLAVALVLFEREGRAAAWFSGFKSMAALVLAWFLGFSLTWFSKWVMATLFTSENVILDGLNAFLYRSSGLDDFTRADAVVDNFNMLPLPVIIAVLSTIALMAVVRFRKSGLLTASLLVLLSAMPYLWYLLAANHSYQHWWFTYRLQAVSLMSLVSALCCLVDWDRWKVLLCKLKPVPQRKSKSGRE